MSGGSKGGPGDRDPSSSVDWLPHEAVLVVDSEALQAKSDLIPTKVHAIVDLCDGTRTAQQVVAASVFDEQRTNKILERLLEDQIVIVGSIGHPVRPSPLVGTASGVLEPSPEPSLEPAPRVERARITAEIPALPRQPQHAAEEEAAVRKSPRLVYLGLAVVGLFGGAWLIQDLRGSEEQKDGNQRVQQPRSALDAAAKVAPALPSKSALPLRPAAAPALDAAAPAPPTGPGYATLLTQAEEVLRAPQRWEEMSKYQQRRMRKLLQQAVTVNPKGWQALQELALIELKRSDLKQATQLARQAMKVYPDAPYAHLVLGASLQERGQKEQARAAYQRFLELCPRCRYSAEIRHITGQL
jgi:hypothetical protein